MSTLAELLGRRPLSLQRGTISVGNVISQTATIAPVNLSTSIVIAGSSEFSGESVAVRLSTATTVEAILDGWSQSSGGYVVPFEVVDFGAMVKGVQRGVIGPGGSSSSISPVDPSKCAVFITTGAKRGNLADRYALTYTLAATSLALSTAMSAYAACYWQILEFH